jgi:trans-aconitate methyltransferase
MKIYNYKDYAEYVEWQIQTNKEKKDWVYVKPDTINKICTDKRFATTIICHGTRAAAEQKFFQKRFPKAEIIGTEISDNATEYPMTIQHDFNVQKTEWIGKFDIVYSNAINHSIDPEATLSTWRDQLSPTGKLYIEYCENLSIPGGNVNDPLDATSQEIENLLLKIKMNIVTKITKNIKGGGIVFVCEKQK